MKNNNKKNTTTKTKSTGVEQQQQQEAKQVQLRRHTRTQINLSVGQRARRPPNLRFLARDLKIGVADHVRIRSH